MKYLKPRKKTRKTTKTRKEKQQAQPKKANILSVNKEPEAKNTDTNEKRPVGKPLHQKTEKTIKIAQALARHGVQGKLIAIAIGISEPTLIKHYKSEMQIARAYAHDAIGRSIYQMGVNGNFNAAKWYSQSQMGWRELRPEDSIDADADFSFAIDEAEEADEADEDSQSEF